MTIFDLSPINATLNGLSTLLICGGWISILRDRKRLLVIFTVIPALRSRFDRHRKMGKFTLPSSLRPEVLFLLLVPLFSSCNQAKIAVYRIPKETVALETNTGSLAPAPPSALPKWAVPADWKEEPLSEMRLASFKAEGASGESADISVTSFPGDVGGLESNINRWRGQVHQNALDPDSLAKTLERETVDGVPVVLVDLRTPEGAEKPDRIIGAILRTTDRTWFVKMTGPPALLQEQAGKFKQFVDSFRFPSQPEPSDRSVGSGKVKSTNDE